jgi:putative membrane-bound dehydrogenase-like protein
VSIFALQPAGCPAVFARIANRSRFVILCAVRVRPVISHLKAILAGTFSAGLVLFAQAPALAPIPQLGIRAAPIFQVSVFADARLAPSVGAMTLDAWGRVVIGGPGYIRVLSDTDTNGVLESVTTFAHPPGTPTALALEGSSLLVISQGALWRYRDNDQNGLADGPPERLLEFTGAPDGWRSLRLGPDGWWYLLCGSGEGPKLPNAPLDSSPIRHEDGGTLLRFSPDWQEYEIIAHGFISPAGLAFNPVGDAFTFDAESPRDFLLPWYAPAQFHHIAFGGHHGWRSSGALLAGQGRARPGYYADTVPPLGDGGRARPADVTAYQHRQFPEHFHDGLFAADWAQGRVFFLPLNASGASYAGQPEVVLEALGNSGFAPSALAVAPDGALLVATGRGAQGGILRLQYNGVDTQVREYLRVWHVATPLDHVLAAPQPLAEWSRADWEAVALRLSAETLSRAAAEPLRPPAQRVRAIEIVTRMFGGVAAPEAAVVVRAREPEVRARLAWSLGFKPVAGFTGRLLDLANDAHPLPRRFALEALVERYLVLEDLPLAPTLKANLGHPDHRIRLLAARLAALLPAAHWQAVKKGADASAPSQLGLALAASWREPGLAWQPETLDYALPAWAATGDPALRLESASLVMMALGDHRRTQIGLDTMAGYMLGTSLAGRDKEVNRIRQAVRSHFPTGHGTLDAELSRLLAMLDPADPKLPRRVLAKVTATTPASLDFHYLAVLARLSVAREPAVTAATADALGGLGRKLAGVPPEMLADWHPRLAELGRVLLARDPALAEALLSHRDFDQAPLLPLAGLLSAAQQIRAASRFLPAAARDAHFVATPELAHLLAKLPIASTKPYYRRAWPTASPEVQAEFLRQLARVPEELDRPAFAAGLEAPKLEVAAASLTALAALPPDDSARNLAPLVRLIGRLAAEPGEAALRKQAVALLNRQTGQPFAIAETNAAPTNLPALYQPIADWFAATYPALAKPSEPSTKALATLEQILRAVPWAKGDVRRGALRFDRACAECHANPELAPSPADFSARMPPLELFRHIAYPNLRVAPAWQLTEYRLRNGQVYGGRAVYENADLRLVQTAAGTIRLRAGEVIQARPTARSPMPEGLIKGWSPADLADLWMFLRAIGGGP